MIWSTPPSELEQRVLQALLDMQDAPHPAQAYGEVAEHLGHDDIEEVYAILEELVREGWAKLGDRSYTPKMRKRTGLQTALGFYLPDLDKVRARLGILKADAEGRAAVPAGPRFRPSALAERLQLAASGATV